MMSKSRVEIRERYGALTLCVVDKRGSHQSIDFNGVHSFNQAKQITKTLIDYFDISQPELYPENEPTELTLNNEDKATLFENVKKLEESYTSPWVSIKDSLTEPYAMALLTDGKTIKIGYLNEHGNFYSMHRRFNFECFDSRKITHHILIPPLPPVADLFYCEE